MRWNLNNFLEPPHVTQQPERPYSHGDDSAVSYFYDESTEGPPQIAYGPSAHDSDGNSIAGQQIPYERIEDE